MRIPPIISVLLIFFSFCTDAASQALRLNDLEYFESSGVNVMVFQDIYPDGHQGGVSIIQNGIRLSSNGDLRLEPTPGQWQPIPVQHKRIVDRQANRITVFLSFPDSSRNRKGFNPIIYPDLYFTYQVSVEGQDDGFRIVVDLDRPLPEEWIGKVGFNMELFPTEYFGKTWYMDGKNGMFTRQPGGPMVRDSEGELQPVPLAIGRKLTAAPDDDARRLIIESLTGDLQLLDGRNKHNNGWFVIRSLVPSGASKNAIEWVVRPHGIPGWTYSPVVHVSQIGYHPNQSKVALIELDGAEADVDQISLKRIEDDGTETEVLSLKGALWGKFLRYNYTRFDFSEIEQPGIYRIDYGSSQSQPFRIDRAIFKRNVWQPTLEYFLPVQMCHMRVEEQYRVWHGACHLDDARMAPVDSNHFDGYIQGPRTLTSFKSGEVVPGLNRGGWHDAGDDDLRIESQADEVTILALAYELFGVDYDNTTIDKQKLLAKIHQPDGHADLLQQVEHGILSILGAYRTMGRFYRGIIVPTLNQYVMLGDLINSTDNLFYNPTVTGPTGTHSGIPDDRWVFTEIHAGHEFTGITALAIAGRVLKDYNPELARESLEAAELLWNQERDISRSFDNYIQSTVELLLSTGKPVYKQALLDNREKITAQIARVGWIIGRALPLLDKETFAQDIRKAVAMNFKGVQEQQKKTPFGVPYEPYIWGAGWGIQEFGVQQYFLHHSFPDIVSPEYMLNALNFVLGVHPGVNTSSFASGVGARSMTIAYGFNRADYSYIPGGVVSGTALIRPDFPEMKDFPYLWQQSEYVMGGGASNYMFLVLAADHILDR